MEKAVFIDLQGTLGGEGLLDISSFSFYSFSKEAIELFKEKGYKVFVITNQSRIRRGYITIEEYYQHEQRLFNEIDIDGIECCPHIKEDNCNCKKPKTGMIDAILKNHSIDIENSYVIGDMGLSDMLLANNINSKSILVLTGVGVGSMNEYRHTWDQMEPTYVCDNILEAAKII